jgi:uncharacterized protein YjiS (DUF1127 family)
MLTALLSRLSRMRQSRDGIHRLSQLDDRLLADMDITRSDISRLMRGEPVQKKQAIRTAAAPPRNAYLRADAPCSDEETARATA